MNDWLEQELDRPYHEVAQLFPLMLGAEFEQLKADIAANGLLEAVWLHPDGNILDGRNRHRACIETKTRPRFRTWGGEGSLVNFVVSMNLHRRHLNESQRAMVAAKIANMSQGRQQTNGSIDLFSQPKAAQTLNVSTPSVKRAKQVLEHGTSELQEAVEQGQIAVSVAAEVAKGMAVEQQDEFVNLVREGKTSRNAHREIKKHQFKAPDFLEGEYQVIYADPPWQFSNSGFNQSAAAHYPTMPTEEIGNLPIDKLTSMRRGSVLFLWATNAMLEDALWIIREWNFEYKTNLAWIKNRPSGMGWFVENRHELLLIATNFPGLHPKEKPASVFEALATEHSKKPACIYEMIERMYDGPYIELFARNTRERWDSWGNEI